jgi:anti-sigma factor RsiW
MTASQALDCATVDELAPAYGLGAVEPGEEQAVSLHLTTCPEPHAEARELVDAATLVSSTLEPVAPSFRPRESATARSADRPAASGGYRP